MDSLQTIYECKSMCLIFISLRQHPQFPLLMAANRDEFYQRQTAVADFWPDHPHVLGGRDLEAGGTWMGITRSGRISLLTNYRDLGNLKTQAPSRGHLVSDYLLSQAQPEDYLKQIEPTAGQYNGFNVLVGTHTELFYLSNYKKGIAQLAPGLHGLSNHLLNTPWPKVARGKEKIAAVWQQPHVRADEVFEVLFDDLRAPDDQLPDTGIGLERERALSSMFIKSPGYGTRCSTFISVDLHNHVFFAERTFDLTTFQHRTRTFEFDLAHG
jgi:uncharacterized protein with NRDE domain